VPRTSRVFLSYRRDDSKHAAARIAERLDGRFQLFMDVDAIQPGMDFTAVMASAVGQSDVLVAVIGSGWLEAADSLGRRRLDDPSDWVATELTAALQHRIMIIPVLVDGAQMPSRHELPPALADLSSRQALRISHETFAADTARLISAIESAVAARTPERIARLHAQIRTLAASGQWAALLAADTEVAALDPRAADVDGLASMARRELSQVQAAANWAGGPPQNWAPPPTRFSAGAGPPARRLALPLIIGGVGVVVLAVVAALLVNRALDQVTASPPSTNPSSILTQAPNTPAVSTPPSQPSTSAPPPSASAPPSTGSEEYSALLVHVPPAYATQCREVTEHKFPVIAKNLTIALRCDLLSGQPDGVEYYQYESAAAMKKAFDDFFKRNERGSCMTAPGTDRWRVAGNDKTLGVLHCYTADNGQVNYVWTREDLAIMGWTYSTSLTFPAMYAFWTTAGPF
jgi:hypothetical protein